MSLYHKYHFFHLLDGEDGESKRRRVVQIYDKAQELRPKASLPDLFALFCLEG